MAMGFRILSRRRAVAGEWTRAFAKVACELSEG